MVAGVGWDEYWRIEKRNRRELRKETSEGDGYIHYHNFGDGFMCINICKSILNMCRFLLSQLYLNF